MRKSTIALAAILAMLVTVATTAQSQTAAPGFVQNFLAGAPGNVFVGVGYGTGHNAEAARFNSVHAATADLVHGIEGWIATSLAANGDSGLAREFLQSMVSASESALFRDTPQISGDNTLDHVWSRVADTSFSGGSFYYSIHISKGARFSQLQPSGSQTVNHIWNIFGAEETEGMGMAASYTIVANGSTRVALQGTDAGGTVWTVVFLNKSDVVMESEIDVIESELDQELIASPSPAFRLVPEPVANFLDSLSEDSIFGIGVARMSSVRLSTAVAEHRARVGLGSTLDAGGRTNSVSFVNEFLSETIVEADVSGTKTVVLAQEPGGTVWAVVVLDRNF
ncbi:MAG: hypothetical protein FWG66_02515 [Spirochaetes bacterium]|nr:hypothetical protein [Spirochaetota bacterium]